VSRGTRREPQRGTGLKKKPMSMLRDTLEVYRSLPRGTFRGFFIEGVVVSPSRATAHDHIGSSTIPHG
jgi:hypothetical protein